MAGEDHEDAPVSAEMVGQAAKAAGVFGIGVTWGANSTERLQGHFDAVVHDVPELCAVLAGKLTLPALAVP